MMTRQQKIIFCLFSAAAALFAGTKPTPVYQFQFYIGLTDNGSSYSAEDGYLAARWTYDSSVAVYDFKWQYRIDGGEWVELPSAKVSDGFAYDFVQIQSGQHIEIKCYAQYVPPVQVVTNGVYHVNGVMRSMDTATSNMPKYVTPGVPIKAGEHTLTPVLNPIEMPVQTSETEED